jgi:hypothetical protein
MINRMSWASNNGFGLLRAWLVGLTMLGAVFSGRAADDEATTATKTGGITVYNDKRGMNETDIKAGPVTSSAITPHRTQEETLTTATRIGNVTELTGSKGTKSTVVTVGPMTGGKVNGQSISVTRIGENVALGTDESGGTMKALKVGNQVVVQKSGTVSPSEVRIIVQVLQDPAASQAPDDKANDVAVLPFTGVDASGDILVEVEGGQPFGIAVANKQTRALTTFAVEDGVLRIKCVGAGKVERGSRRVVVRLPNLVEATATEGAQLAARNVTGSRCLVVSRGGGKVDISGKVDAAQYRVSGGGQVLGQNLRTVRMVVRVDGDGEVHCKAEQELVVVITGKGVVWSHGQPGLVTRKITGGGELKFEK